MSNGTVTLECALAALGVGPGDEVIVPDLTWIATAMSVRYVGATCVFADIEKTTGCLDPASFERLITPKTKWKYNVALSFARECIKGDPLAWTRDICTSLKIKSNELTKNKYPNSLWYQELEKMFKNSINK
jgi:hypothetical protein